MFPEVSKNYFSFTFEFHVGMLHAISQTLNQSWQYLSWRFLIGGRAIFRSIFVIILDVGMCQQQKCAKIKIHSFDWCLYSTGPPVSWCPIQLVPPFNWSSSDNSKISDIYQMSQIFFKLGIAGPLAPGHQVHVGPA